MTSNVEFLNQRGIEHRMNCNSQTARRIANAFITVEQMVDVCESEQSLTDVENIGPTTAETIEAWFAERFERERSMDSTAEFVKTGEKTGTIHNLGDWSDALGMEERDS
jgi:NAD-dependent DNA ligase